MIVSIEREGEISPCTQREPNTSRCSVEIYATSPSRRNSATNYTADHTARSSIVHGSALVVTSCSIQEGIVDGLDLVINHTQDGSHGIVEPTRPVFSRPFHPPCQVSATIVSLFLLPPQEVLRQQSGDSRHSTNPCAQEDTDRHLEAHVARNFGTS